MKNRETNMIYQIFTCLEIGYWTTILVLQKLYL